jgi:hypothetical protein
MTTGVQCKIDPLCAHAAPVESRICHVHQRLIRVAAMRESGSLAIRIAGQVLTMLTDIEPEAAD